MSLIGTLEQIELSRVLERIEAHAKTGLLVIKPGGHWVELYFRAGRLICIGPVRTQASLGERLLQEGLITHLALQEAVLALGEDQFREARMALTLMDMGCVSHEDLRSWSSQKALQVLQAIFAWSSGEIYFDDDVQPPADRLLVALSVSTLLAAIQPGTATAQPLAAKGAPVTRDLNPSSKTSSPDIARYPTLMSASQFFDEAPANPPSMSLPTPAIPSVPSVTSMPAAPPPASAMLSPIPAALPIAPATGSLSPLFDEAFDSVFGAEEKPQTQQTSEPPASAVVPPQYVDTTFMRPDMVMLPTDLSTARDQNVQFQLAPEHWLLLTRVDGRTSLGAASYELQMQPDIICRLAGQLQALGLIQLSVPGQMSYEAPQEPAPASQGQMYSEVNSGYMLPGYAAATPSPWSAALPAVDNVNQFSSSSPSYQAQAPGGNAPNSIPNFQQQNWQGPPQAPQDWSTSGPFLNSGVYVNTQ